MTTADRQNGLKVMVIVDSLRAGGAERSLLSLLPELKKHGIEPRLVCLKNWRQDNLEREALGSGFSPHYLTHGNPRTKWYLKLVTWIFQLRRLVARETPDLVHSTLFQSSITCRLALLGLNIPLLSSVVNFDYSPERLGDPNTGRAPALKLRLIKAINRATIGLVTHFHAVTPAVKQETVNQLRVPPEKVTVVNRGRTPFECPPDTHLTTRSTLGIPPDSKLIINVGRQEHQKGQIDLIRALSEPPLRDPKVKLIIAGREGGATAQLQKEIKHLKLNDRVLMLGHRRDVPELLASSDVFVLPSLFEGAAGAVLEALAARIPVVMSDLAELRELISDECAKKVPTHSPRAIAEAVSSLLLDNEAATKMSDAGYAAFRENFLLGNVSLKMAELYLKVASLHDRESTPRSAGI